MPAIVIVGVGPFISSSLARKLVAQGWNVALLSRSRDKLDALASELKELKPNAKIVTYPVDVTKVAGFLQALDASKKELGSIDVLCYNAARVGG